MVGKYDEIDQMILDSLTDKPKKFYEIYAGKLYQACVMIAGPKSEPARVLDRRLQALKNKGLVYHAKGWMLVPF
ncbi:hypothetical protein [Pseudescherichia vulneris]|uniref:hypothetical protein n=1 Tax=Pseudescherichia vulneris TaxID=566 RepID=UPI0028D025D3|nr:hypothetical protein [Pseudescherichia vulneris]